jgi:hypothetical protein
MRGGGGVHNLFVVSGARRGASRAWGREMKIKASWKQ